MDQIQTPQSEPVMITVRQCAKRKLLPEGMLRKLIRQGKLPVVKSGRTKYINYTKLCEQLSSCTGPIYDDNG